MTATYDPDRELWIPGRRRFLFLSGMALAGTVLQRVLPVQPGVRIIIGRGHFGYIANPVCVSYFMDGEHHQEVVVPEYCDELGSDEVQLVNVFPTPLSLDRFDL